MRSPIKAAAVLLGIYIGMYLAVAGMVHVLTSPDALAATAPDSSTASRADVTAVTHIAGAIESSPSDSLGQVSERTDNSRECKPSAAIDFACYSATDGENTMRRSTCLNYPAALEATTRGAGTRNDSPIAIVRRGSADNDATCEDPVISMDEVERRAQYARAANGLDDVASIDAALSAWPTGDQLLQAPRTRRAFTLSKIIASAIRAAGALARWAHARYRQRRQAKAIYDALRQLDDRTLHDLGFDRSEIWSVAAEATGAAEYTRAQLFDGVDR